MILEWYWIALIGLITMFLGVFAVWKTELQGPAAGINARMKDFAKQAVEVASKEYQTNLDYSPESIQKVDTILEAFTQRHASEPIPEKELSKVVLVWGAYIGTTFIKHHGGKWGVDSLIAGANTYPITFSQPDSANAELNAGKQTAKICEALPVMWCLKRIRRGQKESVAMQYEKIL